MNPEVIWLDRDNSINLILKADGEAVNLSNVSRMTFEVGDVTIDSDNDDADPIRWHKDGYALGEVRIFAGDYALRVGRHAAPLVVYDATYTNGLVWGKVPVVVQRD